ncbi:hypothetical protein JTB14_012022 [Gonioctena quinquepunctata]|nr:hypothetical protein JTB14_012022 [Gonioctena quinquepunctata]
MYVASFVSILCFVILCIEVESHKIDVPVVTTSLGKIRGSSDFKTRLGKTIYAFRNIRYAKPPINELRFQPPVPVEKWNGIYDATQDGVLCPQPQAYGNSSEDCLILNVYATKLPIDKHLKRPVIVHIHAGGFYSVGSPSYWAGPDYYLDQDIVLVTFNYRLATLGFLSTGDKHAPGNNGFKDQVEVLKWVQNNIQAFGGDPNSVTLVGYSAGGWSNVLHMLSPMSQGLFHKVISMSGTPVGIWPIPTNQLELARRQARVVGCPDDTPENIVKCLKTVSSERLGQSLGELAEFGWDPILRWSPVIEGDFGQQRFLHDDPTKLIKAGQFQNVPFMVGQTEDELLGSAYAVVNNESLAQEMTNDFERIAPISFLYERNTERSRKISRAIKKFYLNDKPVVKTQLENLSRLYTDAIMGFQSNRAAKLFSKYGTSPVYYYCFTFQGRYSHLTLPGTNDTAGVVHHDDLYIYFISKDFSRLTEIHANFARTGNPTPQVNEKLNNLKWDRFTLESQKYLDIGENLIGYFLEYVYTFWKHPTSFYIVFLSPALSSEDN